MKNVPSTFQLDVVVIMIIGAYVALHENFSI